MEEIAKELESYNLDITAIQEVRWEGSGEITKGKYTFLYSGGGKTGNNGVAFYIRKKLVKNIIEFTPVDGRIALLKLKMENMHVLIINIYAPTEVAEQDEKDRFYENLGRLCEGLPKKDEIIILGDANAQIGKEPYLSEVRVNRKGTIHEATNDNGHRLCQLAETCNMTFLSTKYEHPKKHKANGDIRQAQQKIKLTIYLPRKGYVTRQ